MTTSARGIATAGSRNKSTISPPVQWEPKLALYVSTACGLQSFAQTELKECPMNGLNQGHPTGPGK